MEFYRIVVSISSTDSLLTLNEFTKQLGFEKPVDLGIGKFTSVTDFDQPMFFNTRIPYGLEVKGYYINGDGDSVEYHPFGEQHYAMDV